MQILVASGDRAIRTRLRILCAASGAGVIEASSIGEAVEAALIWPVAGAVVDLTGDLPGRRTVELIHQCRPFLPLVVITEGGAAESVPDGVIGTLPEPYGPVDVERALALIRASHGRSLIPAAA